MAVVDVSVLIVSYNTCELTLRCLASLADGTDVPYEVIVVDNASSDDTVARIGERFPDVTVLPQRENLGFARAVNLASRHARGQYLLLLNPDTVVLEGAVERLLDFARSHPEHGVYGGRTLHPDGSVDPRSCWGAPSTWSLICFGLGLSTLLRGSRIFDPESLGRWQRDAAREVGVVTGCLLLVRRDLFLQLGGFDPRYFMYGEDVDLSLRARRAGLRPAITPEATVVHHGGASSGGHGEKMALVMRGKATLVREHMAGPRRALGLAMLWLGTGLRASLAAARDRLGGDGPRRSSAWREVWRSRERWLAGYPPAPETWRPASPSRASAARGR